MLIEIEPCLEAWALNHVDPSKLDGCRFGFGSGARTSSLFQMAP